MISDKQLCKDWLFHIPTLKQYKRGRKLLTKFECIVFGIELRKIFDDTYRPEFIALNLLSSYCEFSLERELRSKKMVQYEVPYLKHDKMLEEAVTLMREQAPSILINENRKTDDIIKLYQEEIKYTQTIGVSPLSAWFSLIQTANYYGLDKLKNKEREKMIEYAETLPSESLAIFGDFDKFVNDELDVDKDELEVRRIKNLSKLKLSD